VEFEDCLLLRIALQFAKHSAECPSMGSRLRISAELLFDITDAVEGTVYADEALVCRVRGGLTLPVVKGECNLERFAKTTNEAKVAGDVKLSRKWT
jgi:hypothetical protein